MWRRCSGAFSGRARRVWPWRWSPLQSLYPRRRPRRRRPGVGLCPSLWDEPHGGACGPGMADSEGAPVTETRKFDDDFVVDPRWWEHQFAQTVTPGTGKTWTYVVEPISFHAEEEIAFTKGTRWQTIRWR